MQNNNSNTCTTEMQLTSRTSFWKEKKVAEEETQQNRKQYECKG